MGNKEHTHARKRRLHTHTHTHRENNLYANVISTALLHLGFFLFGTKFAGNPFWCAAGNDYELSSLATRRKKKDGRQPPQMESLCPFKSCVTVDVVLAVDRSWPLQTDGKKKKKDWKNR